MQSDYVFPPKLYVVVARSKLVIQKLTVQDDQREAHIECAPIFSEQLLAERWIEAQKLTAADKVSMNRLTLHETAKNAYGDPQPKLTFRDSPESAALRGYTEDSIKALFQRMARAGNGEIIRTGVDDFQDHPGGGCRMGNDPATSVVDNHGRAHDHENLFVVGAPTSVTGGCANGTLTFLAVSLRQAVEIGRELGSGG